MKTTIAILCLACAPAFAQQQTATSTESLVKAAKEAKANQKKHPPSKVITNKDVKQAKGKLIVLDKPVKPVPKADPVGPIEKQDADMKARKAAQARVDAAQKKVDDLQKTLDVTEQQYYEENDPNYRDSVIQKRFAQAKRQLDDARHELADARDSLQKTEKP